MMKVFKMNDFDWVCAETEEQAKEYYKNECGFDDEDINEGFVGEVSLQEATYVDIDELPESEKNNFQCGRPLGDSIVVRKTFEWVIKNDNITSPCIIASTEY
ncbi:hypothetical protein COL32_27680 [Bacillus pseudomycoides]|uniref:hypothetical protein n=1 Tax=Bacillus pseudomycoides TaxID=64104 RepID=UPI000BF39503|nr:hypothetical protein [Bacillus pseudomycoides]PFW87229.1 hypothetical protein COL29_29745 [Bacillus pseudomycoides]PFX37071.1 hypothetical protein COL32_27680 [Bacillus pseudomycoides]